MKASRRRNYRRRAGALRDEVATLTRELAFVHSQRRADQRTADRFACEIASTAFKASDMNAYLDFRRDPPTRAVVLGGERLVGVDRKRWRSEQSIDERELSLVGNGQLVVYAMQQIVRDLEAAP